MFACLLLNLWWCGAVIIFPSPRIPNGINADCKIGVYAYHWKHKRCTIKMWHEYLSSKFPTLFREQRVASNYFSSFSCMRHHWVVGTRKYKAFRINHIFIIFTLARVARGGDSSKMAGIYVNLFDFMGGRESEKETLSLSAYLSFHIFAIPHRKLLIKIRIESF